jgi:hypothetical protein
MLILKLFVPDGICMPFRAIPYLPPGALMLVLVDIVIYTSVFGSPWPLKDITCPGLALMIRKPELGCGCATPGRIKTTNKIADSASITPNIIYLFNFTPPSMNA